MDCKDIYCKVKARQRLKNQGLTEKEAKEVSDEVFDTVKEIWDKYHETKK
jgi:hypothetical protein